MMNLNSTNEEIEALKYFLGEGNKVMNQLLISNCETDIALLSNEAESKKSSISYERESIISNLLKIKALYTLILKQYYKANQKNNVFYRGTDLSEIDRLKNEPFIDKMISATQDESIAESEFASNWNRPICMNLKLNSDIPYLIVKDVLEDSESDEVVIAPFTKIKAFDLVGEKQLANSKTMKVYNVELEKQELEELTDRERFGLYNYILDNSHLIKRKLEECISLEEENAINFENIRKLEQLLVKYENSAEEKESNLEYSDINRQNDYDDVERINKELEDLKLVTTRIFEKRKDDINFVNMWKRNIAVYMIAECKEIEKKFYGMKPVTDETIEIPSIKENIQNSETEAIKKQEFSDTIVLETSNISNTSEKVEENKKIEENENLDEKTNLKEDEETTKEEIPTINGEPQDVLNNDNEIQLEEQVENTNLSEVAIRVKNESKENIEAAEELIQNIKNLISKQQNHARIAGTVGSTYSALNNAFEMKNAAEAMLELLKKLDSQIEEVILEDDNEKLENISKVNIEISTLINYLNNPKIALKNTKVTRFEEMAIIEENELKRGIAERIREIRGEAELKKLKDDLEIIEDKTSFTKFIGFFTGQKKLDEFMEEQIDVRQKAIRKNLSKKLSLAYNYSIHELMAEIEMFVEDNEDDYLVENDVKTLKELAENLRRNYVISDSKVSSIAKKKSGKNLPVNDKKISKFDAIEIETYRFLNKYGYDIELKNDEPKYQDTMASEITRIVEYINSSKIF